jgi:hypothetical protein
MPILNGKKVVDLEVDGVDSRDFPDFSDAYFSSGCYEDGTRLTEDELNKLTDLAGDVLWDNGLSKVSTNENTISVLCGRVLRHPLLPLLPGNQGR